MIIPIRFDEQSEYALWCRDCIHPFTTSHFIVDEDGLHAQHKSFANHSKEEVFSDIQRRVHIKYWSISK